MDMRKCNVCNKEFDFDKEGLSRGNIVVCSSKCAKISATGRGNAYAIHDKSGAIVDTNANGDEKNHNGKKRNKIEQ